MIVTDAASLAALVEEYLQFDAFCFDLETVYTPSAAEAERFEELSKTALNKLHPADKAWRKLFPFKPTDPLLNEIIWIGMATYGRSDAIACGHPNGTLIRDAWQEKVPACDAYESGDPRRLSPTGKLSKRAVLVKHPAKFGPPPPQLTVHEALEILRPLFFHPTIRKINQNLKFDIKTTVKYYDGEFMPGPYGDTAIVQHLVDENIFTEYSLENFVRYHFGHEYNKLGKKGVQNFSFEHAARYAEQDARFTWLLWMRKLWPALQREPLLLADHELIEQRLYGVLMRKEYRGVLVDRKKMDELRPQYEKKLDAILEQLIIDWGAPADFNPNAPVQVGDLIYKKYKAPVLKKTDGGQPSTEAAQLEIIAEKIDEETGEHTDAAKVAQLLIDYAESDKLVGTYFYGMGSRLDAHDRLHPDFLQYGADTGRLSCRTPNIHNIPRQSDMRDMFIAPPGYVVISVDYDQIELRWIGKESGDEEMWRLFNTEGMDIHAGTAAAVLGLPVEKVSKDQRTTHGKMPNFLLGYGGSEFSLAAKTGISLEHAKKVLDDYYRAFKSIKPWKANVLREARQRAQYGTVQGERRLIVPPYVETVCGRRRRLPNLLINPRGAETKSEWKRLNGMKNRAERQAVNARIQGSAADCLKVAMIDLQEWVDESGFPLQMAINVHDEIVAICPERDAEEGQEAMETIMSSVCNPMTGEPFLEGWCDLVASGKIDYHWAKG